MHLFIICLTRSILDPMRSAMRRTLLATALVLVPSLALAHPGLPGHTHDLANGFLHPLGGIDHVLAMVAVGLFAAQLGGRALWLRRLRPMMAAAGLAGMSGSGAHRVGIAASIIVLGDAIALPASPCRSRPRWRWSTSSRCSTAMRTGWRCPRPRRACSWPWVRRRNRDAAWAGIGIGLAVGRLKAVMVGNWSVRRQRGRGGPGGEAFANGL
jgi:hypothetical protein